MDPASVCFHAQIASSTTCTSKLARPRPSTSISMADWMNQMVDAVDEAEAADTLPQEEVPTEPATSPRPRMIEVPVNDGRWTADEYAELLWYIAQDLNERDQAILQALLDRQQVDARTQRLHDMENERRCAEAAEHEAHQRSIDEWEAISSRRSNWTMQHFQAVPLLKELCRCVCFPMSMRPFVRMIQKRCHSHSQLSRRLHLRLIEHVHQSSTLAQSLQGLVQEFHLHHLQHHDQRLFQALSFHWQRHR